MTREVHLLENGVPVLNFATRNELEIAHLLAGLLAPVRLQVADNDIAPVICLGSPLLQHPIRLADARGHPEEYLEVA